MRKMLHAMGWLVSLVCLSAVCAPGARAQGATLYEGARVIVGDGSAAIEDGAFVVEGGKITAIGKRGAVKAPAGAATVSLAGKTVMPTIIDTHKHLPTKHDDLVDSLRQFAYYGVGAAMSLGQDNTDDVYQVRAEAPAGAARYFTAGRGITTPEPGRTTAPFWITSEAEGRKAVDENAAKGVNIIKIWVDDRDGQYKKLPAEQYRAIIDEAHKKGLKVAAHIYALSDCKELLRAGVDGFAHSIRDTVVDDEYIQMIKARPNVVLMPNLADPGVARDVSWLKDSLPAAEFEKVQAEAAKPNEANAKTYATQAVNLAKLSAAGMKITVGTDGGVPYAAHLEMEDMVKAGMTPAQVITAATRNGAALLKIDGETGTLAKGRSADFLVLDANPLDNITNTRKINAVYLRGTAVDRAAYRAKWVK